MSTVSNEMSQNSAQTNLGQLITRQTQGENKIKAVPNAKVMTVIRNEEHILSICPGDHGMFLP